MQNTVIAMIVLLLFFVGIIWLQIFLSKANNKWLGLIIPLICFIFSIVTVLSVSLYTNQGITSITETIDGVVVSEKVITSQSNKPSIISMFATVIPIFLLFNVPTFIFLAIYFASREKLKLRNELDKMNVQDLE